MSLSPFSGSRSLFGVSLLGIRVKHVFLHGAAVKNPIYPPLYGIPLSHWVGREPTPRDEFQARFPPKRALRGTHNENGGFGNISSKRLHIDASFVVFSTPSPLSRNPALKIVLGGVLSYHPSVIFAGDHSK